MLAWSVIADRPAMQAHYYGLLYSRRTKSLVRGVANSSPKTRHRVACKASVFWCVLIYGALRDFWKPFIVLSSFFCSILWQHGWGLKMPLKMFTRINQLFWLLLTHIAQGSRLVWRCLKFPGDVAQNLGRSRLQALPTKVAMFKLKPRFFQACPLYLFTLPRCRIWFGFGVLVNFSWWPNVLNRSHEDTGTIPRCHFQPTNLQALSLLVEELGFFSCYSCWFGALWLSAMCASLYRDVLKNVQIQLLQWQSDGWLRLIWLIDQVLTLAWRLAGEHARAA